jgi:ABC-type bacteriocin/lantibiotic exporter with double-glycine peptidase domain
LQTLGSEPHPLRIVKGSGATGGWKSGAEAARARKLWAALPGLWVLARPHRGLLAISLVLIAIGRAAGLALPGSTKFLIDGVIANHRTSLLLPLVGAVVLATIIRASLHSC